MMRKYLVILGMLLSFWVCIHPGVISADQIRGQDIRPYQGLLRNFSAVDISIPSQDSSATLILPACGEVEYTVWKPNFDIFGYVGKNQIYYKNISIGPHTKFTFFGKTYDFLAEICPELPAPRILPRQCPPPPLCLPDCEPAPKPKSKPRKSRVICPS